MGGCGLGQFERLADVPYTLIMRDTIELFGLSPNCWKRQLTRIRLVELCIAGAWAVAAAYLLVGSTPWSIFGLGAAPSALLLFVPFLVIVPVGAVWRSAAKRAWNRRALAAEYLLCPECGYDMHGHKNAQDTVARSSMKCPECAAAVDANRTRRMWRELLGKK